MEILLKIKLICTGCSDNCVRTGKGYCRIQWQSNAATSPNSFQLDATAGTEATTGLNACPLSYVEIPNGSQNGQTALNSGISPLAFQSVWCGDELGISGQPVGSSIVCKSIQHEKKHKKFVLFYFSFQSAFQSWLLYCDSSPDDGSNYSSKWLPSGLYSGRSSYRS